MERKNPYKLIQIVANKEDGAAACLSAFCAAEGVNVTPSTCLDCRSFYGYANRDYFEIPHPISTQHCEPGHIKCAYVALREELGSSWGTCESPEPEEEDMLDELCDMVEDLKDELIETKADIACPGGCQCLVCKAEELLLKARE